MNKDVKIIQKMKVKMTGKMILMKSKCSSGMREYTFVHDVNEVSKQICIKKTCLMLCGEGHLLRRERERREKERREEKKKKR